MRQSELLTQFYRAYWDWSQAGQPDDNPQGFQNDCGLCYNAQLFGGPEVAVRRMLVEELTAQFEQAGLDHDYPFDAEGDSYDHCAENRTMHQNPARMQWVQDHMYV